MPDTESTVSIRLELTPAEAGALEAFIFTNLGIYHGNHTRTTLSDIRHRLHDALLDLRAVTS